MQAFLVSESDPTASIHVYTVFNRIETAATINFSTVQVRLLIEGGSYSRAGIINFVPDFRLCVITSPTNITHCIMVFQGAVSIRVRRHVYDL